ncbi:hypothetical protein CCACVL1_02976, partial [Corchorus capsularis]
TPPLKMAVPRWKPRKHPQRKNPKS